MLAIGGVILICSAFYMGLDGDFDFERMERSQVVLLAGVAAMTWALLNSFKWLADAIPLAVGAAVFVLYGVYERELVGAAGGFAIVSIWFWNLWRARKKRN